MVIRVFMSVIVLSPLVLVPSFTLKLPLCSHTSGMIGALLGLVCSCGLSALIYYSETFSNSFLAYRGAVNRRSLWTVLCGLELNALLWILAISIGYVFGLNVAVLRAAITLPFRLSIAFSIYAGVALLVQALLIAGFFYGPLLRFIGFEEGMMYTPVKTVMCCAASIVTGELLGFAFAVYSMLVFVIAELAKDTLFLYVLGLYGLIFGVLGTAVTVRACFILCCKRQHRVGLASAQVEFF